MKGINMSYKKIFEDLQDNFTNNPEEAITSFSVSSRLINGLKTENKIRSFTSIIDEPENIGGDNAGPTPVEVALSSLATCQEITYRYYADKLDIPVKSVEIEINGELDFKGFLSVSDNIRPGYQDISVNVYLDSSANTKQLEKLKDTVDKHCPVLDLFRNPTPVNTRLVTKEGLKKILSNVA